MYQIPTNIYMHKYGQESLVRKKMEDQSAKSSARGNLQQRNSTGRPIEILLNVQQKFLLHFWMDLVDVQQKFYRTISRPDDLDQYFCPFFLQQVGQSQKIIHFSSFPLRYKISKWKFLIIFLAQYCKRLQFLIFFPLGWWTFQ